MNSEKRDTMKKILFICFANQCRSPMAEYLFNDMLARLYMDNEYRAESAGVWSRINYQPANIDVIKLLRDQGIDCSRHEAKPFMRSDLEKYEYIICMDDAVLKEVLYIAGVPAEMYRDYKDPHKGRPEDAPEAIKKIYKLLDFTERAGQDVSDPMITGDFIKAWEDIEYGCIGLLTELVSR